MAGFWEFPGGAVEKGETPAEALERELREELGIAARVGAELARAVHAYEFGTIELIGLLVEDFTGDPALIDHDRLEWVAPERLLEFALTPADVPLAKTLAGGPPA